jgi:hypothetical protein
MAAVTTVLLKSIYAWVAGNNAVAKNRSRLASPVWEKAACSLIFGRLSSFSTKVLLTNVCPYGC